MENLRDFASPNEKEPNLENNEVKWTHAIRVLRHPEKGTYSGPISDKGEEDAKKMGSVYARWKKMFPGVGFHEIRHSEHKRPKRAAELVKESFEGATKESVSLKEDKLIGLERRFSEAFDKEYEVVAEKAKTASEKANFSNEGAGVQFVVDTGDTAFDSESASSVKMSKEIAQSLYDAFENAPEDSSQNLRSLFLSHSGVLENFIVDVLKLRGEANNVQTIGGGLGFFEGFEAKAEYKAKDDYSIHFKFISPKPRSKKYSEEQIHKIKDTFDVTITREELERLAA